MMEMLPLLLRLPVSLYKQRRRHMLFILLVLLVLLVEAEEVVGSSSGNIGKWSSLTWMTDNNNNNKKEHGNNQLFIRQTTETKTTERVSTTMTTSSGRSGKYDLNHGDNKNIIRIEQQEEKTSLNYKIVYDHSSSYYKKLKGHRTLVDNINNDDTNNEDNNDEKEFPFIACFKSDSCRKCFYVLDSNEVDWVSVSSDTTCAFVLNILQDHNYCEEIQDNHTENIFCDVFDTVVKPKKVDPIRNDYINCATLTECKWDGMNPSYLGDGICHNEGCYNTPICQYDQGDCCSDTCQIEVRNPYVTQCGNSDTGRYYCLDPNSHECDPTLYQSKCKINQDPTNVQCPTGSSLYKITMYDSYGDGWDATNLTISRKRSPNNMNNNSDDNIIYSGQLAYGPMGVEYICLVTSTSDTTSEQQQIVMGCYDVVLKGGFWGNEISWDIRPALVPGAPAIAMGGAPMQCQFSVNTASSSNNYQGKVACPNTCTGHSISGNQQTPDTYNDDEVVTLKEITDCMKEKCYIQESACTANDACTKCLQPNIPDWCFSIDTFTSLTDCVRCKCSTKNYGESCATKVTSTNVNDGIISVPYECSATEKRMGGRSIMKFTQCTNFTSIDILLRDYDNEHFGAITSFEDCATSYEEQTMNDPPVSALGCLQVLVNGMHPEQPQQQEQEQEQEQDKPSTINDTDDESPPNYESSYPFAVAQLARLLYYNGQEFCDCIGVAFDDTPNCPTFTNYNVLLYEALEACQALDSIDCDAYMEYYPICKSNMYKKFDTIDFSSSSNKNYMEQCDYVRSTSCGGAGPFPSFRQLDCEKKVGSEAWGFYVNYTSHCPDATTIPKDNGKNNGGTSTKSKSDMNPIPAPTPSSSSSSSSSSQQQGDSYDNINNNDEKEAPSVTSVEIAKKQPYVPPEERGKSKAYISSVGGGTQNERVSSSSSIFSWFRTIFWISVFGCIGYFVYDQRRRNPTTGSSSLSYSRLQPSMFVNFVRNTITFITSTGGGSSRNFNYDDDTDNTAVSLNEQSKTSSIPLQLIPQQSSSALPFSPVLLAVDSTNNIKNSVAQYAI